MSLQASETEPTLGAPPVAVALLGTLALAAREIVVVPEVLLRQRLQLLAGAVTETGLFVHQGVDEPLDPVARRVLAPPPEPPSRIVAEVLAGDRHEREVRRLRDELVAVLNEAHEHRHRRGLAQLAEDVDGRDPSHRRLQ